MEKQTNEDFNERIQFDDRPADDGVPGAARAMDISGRCANCWGPISGEKYVNGSWIRIKCLLCERLVEGKEANREAELMCLELANNLAQVRLGKPAEYRTNASFVFKLIPDMDRDLPKTNRNIEENLKEKPRNGWLTRREIGPGSAGFLYAQARALLAGVGKVSEKELEIAPVELDFGDLLIESVESSDGKRHVFGQIEIATC